MQIKLYFSDARNDFTSLYHVACLATNKLNQLLSYPCGMSTLKLTIDIILYFEKLKLFFSLSTTKFTSSKMIHEFTNFGTYVF